ncbi:MAG: ATP-dependent endonuclease [Hyphomonas sp.]|nr:ATP-dependent endonuclease [Hyphomonas sp.]
MQITSIKIKNFKGLREAEYRPSRFGCIVGENNAGKSSILQALVYALNRPSNLDEGLFYDPARPVVFRLEVDGISGDHLARLEEGHRNRIAPRINEGRFVLVMRYEVGQKVDIKVESLSPIEERYRDAFITEAFKGKRGGAVQEVINNTYPEFVDGAPEISNATEAKEYLANQIRELPADAFEMAEADLPTGISTSITNLLPEPIYIPAVKNINDDLKTSQSTSFGRLLGLLLQDMEPDLADITAALFDLNTFFNRTENEGEIVDARHAKVRELEASIEGLLAENFPAVKIELNVPPPELKTILNSAQILVDDGSKDAIENKGDGIKRSLTFALLQCYVNRFSQIEAQEGEEAIAARPILFLFEEPELYLHPKSQRILFATLEKISRRYQVVVTTHSPLFFAPGITASFVRIAKKPFDPKPVGEIHEVNFDLDEASAESFRLAKFENADAAFFSKRVVLFEGESDDSFFKHAARLLSVDWDFEGKNIAMVQVSGKGNFARFRRFFESFGIEVKIVADLDAFFEGFQHLGAEGLDELRAQAIQAIDGRIQALGVVAEPNARQVKSRVKSESWQTRYQSAKTALRAAQAAGAIDPQTLTTIDQLFVWEDDIARVKACKDDPEAKRSLLPCLDALRAQGICVLSNGAIEDYYPAGTPANGAKPERAMAAVALVRDNDGARNLSSSLDDGREPELVEICAELFRELTA